MQQLAIEYRLDTAHPGYTFTEGARDLSDDDRAIIWRQAMPRGQGWSADVYRGAISIKCFPLTKNQIAVSAVRVTDQMDELGRTGIRHAQITVFRAGGYHSFVETSFAQYPASIRQRAQDKITSVAWRRLLNKALLRAKKHLILAADYRNADDWQYVEALIFSLVTAPGLRMVEGWGKTPAFTTLALDWRDEAGLVALPLDQARSVSGAPVIRV